MRAVTSLIVVVLAFVVFAAPTVVPAHGRVALVVGNSTYAHIGRLPNPDNDARDIPATLRRLGFEVTTDLDAESSEFSPQTTNLGSDEEGRFCYFPILYMLSQVWIGSRDASSSRAALPLRYSATRQAAVRVAVPGALLLYGVRSERLLMEGLQPAVPLVRRVEHGGVSDARRRGQPARGEEPRS